ncbi:HARBI1 [Mytilus coruscus]|uniref:HARBI1 n=1 Tax=Mytilus coruscus TaxID=42192 RepID=A0A6J8D5C9_MYTCO|nr:HARBI1 [Mytilus coruscus]
MFHIARYRLLAGRRAMRREHVFRDRTNPLDLYDDLELVKRFRFDRQTILQIADLLQEDLESSTLRNHAIPPVMKVLIALRFYASGSFQNIIADTFNIDQSTFSRTTHSVSNALVRRAHKFIKFPSGHVIEENRSHKLARCAVEQTVGQWKRRFHCLHSENKAFSSNYMQSYHFRGVLHNIAKKNNIPLNEDDLDDDLDDDMEEVENGMAGNGFHIRKSVTELHF